MYNCIIKIIWAYFIVLILNIQIEIHISFEHTLKVKNYGENRGVIAIKQPERHKNRLLIVNKSIAKTFNNKHFRNEIIFLI